MEETYWYESTFGDMPGTNKELHYDILCHTTLEYSGEYVAFEVETEATPIKYENILYAYRIKAADILEGERSIYD